MQPEPEPKRAPQERPDEPPQPDRDQPDVARERKPPEDARRIERYRER
ncbi:MAG: hypothetical protein HYU37_08635 [Acidobacteria bacterium]|nr:hypothetical protein [Acidobacteriota bacterium]